MTFNPENDGVDHINVYSQAKTQLGRFLTNFSYAPFTCEDGRFQYVEGYWYWLSCKDDKLRTLSGFAAKKYGREVRASDWCDDSEFKRKICAAIKRKICSSSYLREFKRSTLPFVHYYNFGGKIVEPQVENG